MSFRLLWPAPTVASASVRPRAGLMLLQLLLLTGLYVLSGQALGWAGSSLLWPPAGIALAALVHGGPLAMTSIAAGAALLAWQQGGTLTQLPPPVLSQLAGPALAWWLLHRLGVRAGLGRRRDLALFVLCGPGLGGLLSGALGLLGQPALNLDGLDTLWRHWGGDALGMLVVAVPLLSLDPTLPRSASPGWPPRLLQLMLGLAVLAGAGLAFWGAPRGEPGPWLFTPHLLLCWLALRSSLAIASTWALGVALQAALATQAGLGPFMPTTAGLTALWGYMSSVAAIPLLIQALSGEKRLDRQHWRHTLEAVGIGLAEWDLNQRQCFASPGWQQIVGSPSSAMDAPDAWLDLAHPIDQARLAPQLAALLSRAQSPALSEALRLRDATGDWRWYELRMQVHTRGRAGVARRLVATLHDISWQRTAQERERMSVSLFQHLHEGLLVTDTQHRILDANPSYCRLMGLPRDALVGLPAEPLQEAVLRASGHDSQRLGQQLETRGYWQGLVQYRRGPGLAQALQLTVSTIPEPEGPVRYHVVAVTDQTRQMQQQALLEHQQRFDALTGLPNQDEFKRRVEQALQDSLHEGFWLCLCSLDLDQFKRINDQYGRAQADRLLAEVGQRLAGALRNGKDWSDQVARLGGDEFGLLLRCVSADEAQRAVQRVLNVLRAPFALDARLGPLELTASLGATLYPQDSPDAETLLRHATHALYRVKRSGRNGYEFFDTEKRLQGEARVLALGRMQQALDGHELQLHYQPKVDMRGGRVLGVEALLRWNHPERGLLGPAHFLPLIEQTGLAVRVGDWVIEQALKQCSQWLAEGLALHVSVNVAARHLQANDFAQRLQELLARHEAPLARHLVLEVLESTALADIEATQRLIRRCRELGVRFALDDFGTGYSTLTYLKRLPVEMLKIDRSFVQNMLIDDQDRALVEGVIGLARNFGCSVVAEGVESDAHARALLSMGCDHGQGNGIAKPMPAAEVAAWVAQFEHSPVLAGRREPLRVIH